MICLCCGRKITAETDSVEYQYGWHRNCIRRFFGTDTFPDIDLSERALKSLVDQNVNKGLTVPGVQKKLSLHLDVSSGARLTLVNYPTGYILKPQTEEYENLPEYEQMAMHMADIAGIKTVPHALIRMNGTFAYITRRIDRKLTDHSTELLAMEDFCQLSGRLTVDKYKGSYESCGRIIRKYSEYEGFDLSEMFLRVVFAFLIGNSDMHLKNFSLIENAPGARKYHLSEAYDILPVNVVLKSDPDQMALTVHGKKRNIHRNDFLALAQNCGISRKAAENMIRSILKKKGEIVDQCDTAMLSDDQKNEVRELIEARAAILNS